VCLLLAGGASADDLKLLHDSIDRYGLERYVRLHANFPIEQKGDVLAASDVLVSPVDNTQETFGLSLLEAMAAGLPVVASRFDGYKDLVEDGVDGFLVDTYGVAHDPMDEWFDLLDPNIAQLFQSQATAVDLNQLADRLLRLIADVSLRSRLGSAGRAKVDSQYRWSRVIGRYEATWDRLAESAQRTGLDSAQINPFALGPQQLFAHYPSHTLGPDSRLIAAPQPLDERPFNETSMVLRPVLLHAIVTSAARGGSLQELAASVDASTEHALYAIAWLLKYGFLQIESDQTVSAYHCMPSRATGSADA
jgi:hypothetical protein